MSEAFSTIFDIVSFILTVAALGFTLYCWTIDHFTEDESKFTEERENMLSALNRSLETVQNVQDGYDEDVLDAVIRTNRQLEKALSYRFWVFSRQRDGYKKIEEFYRDSRYLASALERCGNLQKAGSAVSVPFTDGELKTVCRAYGDGLIRIIEFLENWD